MDRPPNIIALPKVHGNRLNDSQWCMWIACCRCKLSSPHCPIDMFMRRSTCEYVHGLRFAYPSLYAPVNTICSTCQGFKNNYFHQVLLSDTLKKKKLPSRRGFCTLPGICFLRFASTENGQSSSPQMLRGAPRRREEFRSSGSKCIT